MKPTSLFVFLLSFLIAACGNGGSGGDGMTMDSATSTAPSGSQPPVVVCPPGYSACGQFCVDLNTNTEYCGTCTTQCTATQECIAGACTGCPAGSSECNGQCTNVNTDSLNCGICGNDCGAGVQCVGGLCTCPNPTDFSCLGNACYDGRADEANCGACGSACSTGQECLAGACQCQAGLMTCGAACANTQADPANCGGCGTACNVAGGEVCDGGGCTTMCSMGRSNCEGACVDTMTDAFNCGVCGMQCPAGQACSGGSCGCGAGQELCNGQCIDVASNNLNCGACGVMCTGGQVCSGGMCGCSTPGQQSCNGQCVDTMTSGTNCGTCGVMCNPGESCSGGTCMAVMSQPCAAGEEDCNGTCVAAGTCASGGGSGGGGNPSGGAGGGDPGDCSPPAGMIADFENGSLEVLQIEGRIGLVEQFNDETGTQTTTVETEMTDACNTGVLHTTGSGFSSWGSGIGTVFTGTWDDVEMEYAPSVYDASQYTAISFRAKAGPTQTNPVRMNISVPSTEGPPYGAGNCTDSAEVDNPCWNHIGHFLMDDEALTQQWQTYTFCFDRDLYPMFLPSHLTVEERNTISSRLLKIQFQFNQSFAVDDAMQVPLADPYDFYLDDLRFTNPASCDNNVFQSTDGASDAFGTNSAIGNCMPVPNAAKFNKAISQAYRRWKAAFVRSDGGVVDPQEGSRVVSEAIGYGMLITAAMGDKPAFDSIWGWASGRIGNPPNSLLGWENGGGGSATDGDTDMAFALLMAGKQWGGNYAAAGNALASLALSQDVVGNVVTAGNQFTNAFNPSYFSPGFYRKFSGWGSAISTTYGIVQQCASQFGGLVPDWCQTNGTPVGASAFGAQQQAGEICSASEPCLAFESARTPWRLGYDVCFDTQGQSVLNGFLSKLKSTDATLANGARIDTIEAGWNASGPLSGGVGNAMAFIGPLGVAGMALNDAATRDRAFRATLDIMERPEFYNTYYQATLGMLTLLTMSGNFPTP